ncbi:cupin domain-containing protein [Pseudodesulfovibrio sp.]|uniref:cupin domain-containing protein n=1 Tax=Pseudodesulfovibrio sp. TaxID=2035812 RepID=UPI00262602D6|nr:cupin domain-containing protein [Pseudodesulfovibrio sp.]MDD3312739.1 cupin domain-containing protein [Pseudodesulfovibrio sp.]
MKVIQYTDVEPKELKVAGPGVTGRVVIGTADDDVNFCMRVIELQPGAQIPPHHHPWEHQQFYHSGTGYIVREGQKMPLGPGSVVYVAPDEEHHVANTGNEPLVLVCLIPKGIPEL